ncbi:MAG: hypothetical protein JRF40_12415 [Deltaproteobacteria bacterium]|nr:hypothetical protein [Deltaproteobacteria bacterium]
MHRIKKYANRKLYDTTDKKYVSMDSLSKLIKSGKEISVTDNETGEDLTASVVSGLIARNKGEDKKAVSSGLLIQLFRKGGGALTDYAKKYMSIWQSAFTMAEDEVDRFVNMLVKNKEISKSEGSRLKNEITGYTDSVKRWIADNVDRRINEVLDVMNLPTKDQVFALTKRIDRLEKKLKQYEKLERPKPGNKKK